MNKDITIVCIDTRDSHRDQAAATLAHCQNIFPCKKAILFSDKQPNIHLPISFVYTTCMNDTENRPYDRFILNELPNFIHTEYFLVVQTDGFIMNPSAWDDQFLEYDYIGAPWAHSPLHDWPPHQPTGPKTSVGNGGFSLRSLKLANLVKQQYNWLIDNVTTFKTEHWYPEDCFICRDIRPSLEKKGMKFAPEEVAAKFSCENRPYTGQFGFHGKLTEKMNNIKEIIP